MLRFVRRDSRPFTAAAQSALRPYMGVMAELLFARGVDTAAQAERFLHPLLTDLLDPMLLSGMADALALLAQAKAEGWPTVVYGDYDADGVCAAALMTEALRLYGIDAQPHIPLRAEGYGLNITAVERLAGDYRLMITVDLGITNAAEVTRAKDLGMRVIVTDHHQPGLTPCPADAVINPLLGAYPFAKLCGAGVAYKLAVALHGAETAEQWLDLAALATVADIVPLLSENRVLVTQGLPRFAQRPGLKALADAAGCRMPLDAEAVAYQLAPRLNAAGRLSDANDSVKLLLTRDPAEAEALARKLDAANTERKRLEADTTAQAEKQAEEHDFINRRVLFVRGEDWHTGVIGLVAGRLNRRYGVPVCAMSETDGLLHGSLRGVRGVNLARCLQTCDDLLLRYGGHEMAAGVTLAAENDQAFRERLEQAVRQSAEPDAFVPAQEYDAELSLQQADDALLTQLTQLQPFGIGNPAPVFYTRGARVDRLRTCGAQGAHLQLTLRDSGGTLEGIAFGMGALATRLTDTVDAAYTLNRDTFRGRETIKCQVQALYPPAQAQAALLANMPQTVLDDALLRGLRDALGAIPDDAAGNGAPDAEMNKAVSREANAVESAFPLLVSPEGATATVESLCEGTQGTLFVAYARETAQRFFTAFGTRVDLAQGATDDPRCFHTLLFAPEPGAVSGRWKAVVLLDGLLAPGEVHLWRRSLPAATLYCAPNTQALQAGAAAVDAGDQRYRALYRLLRRSAFASLRQTAQAAALTEAQTLVGLTAFHELGILTFSDVPFAYSFREPCRCSLSDSPVLGALRALSAQMEAREC
ncbi:MAG: single-stranded-DNA-specific exonuclease RecJ [Eubacteriales bacterium]|nr:single-stranded-DNA-specific exonuclease RecJ [Eubacteriales bacterium]